MPLFKVANAEGQSLPIKIFSGNVDKFYDVLENEQEIDELNEACARTAGCAYAVRHIDTFDCEPKPNVLYRKDVGGLPALCYTGEDGVERCYVTV